MARYDGKLTAAGESTIDAAELLAVLGAQGSVRSSERKEAIIRYLSASEGWSDARRLLGGAFAEEARDGAEPAQRLSGKKEG